MAEETIETPDKAPPSEEAGDKPQETIEETKPEEEAPAQDPTTQEIVEAALQKQSHEIQSWIGRRDVELKAEFTRMIGEKKPPEPSTDKDAEEVYTDPGKWLDAQLNKRDAQSSAYVQSVVTSAAKVMDADPLFDRAAPGGKELGAEVVQKVAQMLPGIKPTMAPDQNAELVVNKALAAVMRDRRKTNPLKGNKPSDTPLSTVDSKVPEVKKDKPQEINEHMKNYQRIRGLSDDKMQELLKKDT